MKCDTVYSICYVGPSFRLETDFRFAHKQCPGLVKRGFNVCYFTQSDNSEEPFDFGGVRIYPLKRQSNKWQQVLLPWKLLRRLLQEQCDAYHLGNVELLPIALLLKLFTRRRVVFDCHEDFVEFVRLKPYLKGPFKPLAVSTIKVMMHLAIRGMDGIIFGDEGVEECYPDIIFDRKMLVHHFPLLSMFDANPILFTKRQYDVVYLGTMSETRGVFVMLEAIAMLKKKKVNVKVLFIGEPVKYIRDRFYAFLRDNNIEGNMKITGNIPYLKVPELLNEAKVGLIGLTDLPKFHKQSATKLFEYMAKGIPCVSVDLPPERRFMVSGEHGYLVPPENPQAMADAVYKLLSNEKLGQKMATNCRVSFMEKGYYVEKELDKLAEFYKTILHKPRRSLCGS